MAHICIVTPDIIGPIRNGGIGTACFHLARYLVGSLGHRVTILFTGPVETGSVTDWKAEYLQRYGIELFTQDDLPPAPEHPVHGGQPLTIRSLRVHWWLSERQFDQVHFQEWQANGFIAIRAKRCGLAYSRTLLTCTLHSSTEWIHEGSRRFAGNAEHDMLLQYAERYSAQHADIAITPSRHMADWCAAHGWGLESPVVIPYVYEEAMPADGGAAVSVEELCFFGRLETRKGLELFLEAIGLLLRERPAPSLPKLTFLGKQGMVAAGPAKVAINAIAKQHGLNVKILDSFSASEAIAYLRGRPGRVAVLPSLLDNLPYTVIECLQHRIRFIASNVGGIPELVASDSHLFTPTPRALAAKLRSIVEHGIGPVPSGYSATEAREGWARVVATPPPDVPRRQVLPEDVTVCIAHYNYGQYLPSLLASLERQTVQGFSVIVVDDGSTDAESVRVFRELRHRYGENSRWSFVEKNNGGIGETRNHAASLATTSCLAFMDADNEAEPSMIEVMCRSMSASRVDCLTCHMRSFADLSAHEPRRIVYHYIPTGPCLEAGVFSNCFGDANFIVRAEAFWSIGGFGLQRDASFEDWEFLARLSLHGFRQDVIPAPLFLYRHTPGGFSRTTSQYLNHRRIITAYGAFLPEWGRRLLRDTYASVKPDLHEIVAGKKRNRIGMLRRLERSIRKRRNALLAGLRSKVRTDRPPIT